MKKALLIIALCLLASAVFILYQISRTASVSFRTDMETQSLGGMTAALLIGETGATVGTVHKVVIYPTGEGPKNALVVFLADDVDEIALLWISPEELHICFGKARIFQFTNFFTAAPDKTDSDGRVMIYKDLTGCKLIPN